MSVCITPPDWLEWREGMRSFRADDEVDDLEMQFAWQTGGLGYYPEGNQEWYWEQSHV